MLKRLNMHTYVHTYIHIYTYAHRYIHTYTHLFIHAHIHIYMHAYAHRCTHSYTYRHAHTQIIHLYTGGATHCTDIRTCIHKHHRQRYPICRYCKSHSNFHKLVLHDVCCNGLKVSSFLMRSAKVFQELIRILNMSVQGFRVKSPE